MLLFVRNWHEWKNCVRRVSIHLMLLFIAKTMANYVLEVLFQYISCYSLSPALGWKRGQRRTFQYISYYSLSSKLRAEHALGYQFQYISCYSLSERFGTIGVYPVLFQYIPCYSLFSLTDQMLKAICRFQYIPCYSLSKKLTKTKYMDGCFNTSHVTLYRQFNGICSQYYYVSIHPMLLFICAGIAGGNARIEFQYIPCYSLSTAIVADMPTSMAFQYIPCYSLSLDWNVVPTDIISFQYIPCYSLSAALDRTLPLVQQFQYIPCYSLSRIGRIYRQSTYRFNTSHVTLYLFQSCNLWKQDFVSIHPMLLFILKSRIIQVRHVCFNTSHVTLYLLSHSLR